MKEAGILTFITRVGPTAKTVRPTDTETDAKTEKREQKALATTTTTTTWPPAERKAALTKEPPVPKTKPP